jgi:SH3-like domain-containing protein
MRPSVFTGFFDINALYPFFQAFWRKPALMFAALTVLGAGVAAVPVHAEGEVFDTPSGLQVPRWAMLRRSEVYARNGPSKDNRVVWTYHKASLPVQIISETRDWRLVCDPDGGVAWVSRTMLQAPKTVLSPAGQKLQMRQSPDEKADIKAILKPRVLASLDKCKKGWCRISAAGQTGWVPQPSLWGTQTTAACKRPDPFASK